MEYIANFIRRSHKPPATLSTPSSSTPKIVQQSSESAIHTILFAEENQRNRRVVFDSRNTVLQYKDEDQPQFTPALFGRLSHVFRDSCSYEVSETTDEEDILHMVVGSVELSFNGRHSKLHLCPVSKDRRAPRKSFQQTSDCLMFSKIYNKVIKNFKHRRRKEPSINGLTRKETGYSSLTMTSESEGGIFMTSLEKPKEPSINNGVRKDSGMGRSLSTLSLPFSESSGIFHRTGSASFEQVRVLRDMKTSLSSGELVRHPRKLPKLEGDVDIEFGLVVFIDYKTDFDDTSEEKMSAEWWLDRQQILEFYFSKLSKAYSLAYMSRDKFYTVIYGALNEFRDSMKSMMEFDKCPSINHNWLRLNGPCGKSYVDEALYKPLLYLLNNSDRKETNFFLSRLLTAVLTYHLGWVTTVTPDVTIVPSVGQNTKKTAGTGNLSYNPIWGQLCELYGMIGCPPRITRTIITSKAKGLVDNYLNFLSYIIRCSQVYKRDFDLNDNDLSVDSRKRVATPAGSANGKSFPSTDQPKSADKSPSLSEKYTFSKTESGFSQSNEESSYVSPFPGDNKEPNLRAGAQWMLDDEDDIVITRDDSVNLTNGDDCQPVGFTSPFAAIHRTEPGSPVSKRRSIPNETNPPLSNTGKVIPLIEIEATGGTFSGFTNRCLRYDFSSTASLENKEECENADNICVGVKPELSRETATHSSVDDSGTNAKAKSKFNPTRRTKLVDMPQLAYSNHGKVCGIAESLFRGYSPAYSSIPVLQATSDVAGVKKHLRSDLQCMSEISVGGRLINEAVAIVADTDAYTIEVISSISESRFTDGYQRTGRHVSMSPLVSAMVEKMMECVPYNSHAMLLNCFEYHLRRLYLQSHILADFLLGSTRRAGEDKVSFSVAQLKHQSNIDTYDIPLLFSVATTHSPEIASMFGYYSEDSS